MVTAKYLIDEQDIQNLHRSFKNDTYIKACYQQIYRILDLAKPIIRVYINYDDAPMFDIDEISKQRIQFWRERIKDHADKYYPQIKFK